MRYGKIIRTAVCVLSVCVSVCMAGCSLSFCGFQIGGREELTFSCEGEMPGEAGELPAAGPEESGPREGAQSAAQPSASSAEQGGQPSEGAQPQEDAAQPSASSTEQEAVQPSEGDEAQETVQNTGSPGNGSAVPDGRVDINSAGVEELMTLNGIGETRARAIIEYRTQYGAFTKEEDIMQVPGIKEGIFSKIQNQIAVY